ADVLRFEPAELQLGYHVPVQAAALITPCARLCVTLAVNVAPIPMHSSHLARVSTAALRR
ncbi:MAG TPA: hypothetical protein VHU91_01675, partial [Mycobacteriales bacterium]|nr:hypothetical protein [Mycobacteriales bacterium]